MKTLALVRHAKSSWDHPGLDDHDRTLNERGLRDAPVMAARLAASGLRPGALLSSTAVRARTTAAVFGEALGVPPVLDDRLYGAAPGTLLRVVAERADDAVLVVAHNPGLTALAQHFSGFLAGADAISHMPTCAVAVFTFDVPTWDDVAGAVPASWSFDAPRD